MPERRSQHLCHSSLHWACILQLTQRCSSLQSSVHKSALARERTRHAHRDEFTETRDREAPPSGRLRSLVRSRQYTCAAHYPAAALLTASLLLLLSASSAYPSPLLRHRDRPVATCQLSRPSAPSADLPPRQPRMPRHVCPPRGMCKRGRQPPAARKTSTPASLQPSIASSLHRLRTPLRGAVAISRLSISASSLSLP